MSITTIPDVTEFGGAKSDGYAEVDASKQLAASAWNGLVTRLIAAFGAIGVDDGSTVGSLRAADLALDTRLDDAETSIAALTVDPIPFVTTSTRTITTESILDLGYTAGRHDLTLPAGTGGREIVLVRGVASAYGIRLIPDGSEKINGVAAPYDVPGSDAVPTGALFEVRARYTTNFGPGFGGTWLVWSSVSAIGALTSRVTALEAPTATTNSASSSVSWTTVVEYLHTHTSLTTYTLDANTTQWPVGTARAISQYGTSTAGFQFAVPSGHKLNSVTNGVSGVLATAAADDGSPLQTFLVTRRASDEWTWA